MIFRKNYVKLIENITAKDIVEAYNKAVGTAKAQGWRLVEVSYVSK